MPREVIVYVHGVIPGNEATFHTSQYDALHDGIASRLNADQRQIWCRAKRCNVEWGWAFPAKSYPHDHTALTAAQAELYPSIITEIKGTGRVSVNPVDYVVDGLRPLTAFGFGDMFYYVSEDGKYDVRRAVAAQIIECLKGELDEPVSLTLIGHSAGSVILFDFSFYLFYTKPNGCSHDYLAPQGEGCPDPPLDREMMRLRELVNDGRIRIRRLFTLGSPISMLAFRSNAVVGLVANGGRIDPSLHGLVQNPLQPPLTGPRLVNVWNRADPISWPLSRLFTPSARATIVKDHHVYLSWTLFNAHSHYWRDYRVHAVLAKSW